MRCAVLKEDTSVVNTLLRANKHERNTALLLYKQSRLTDSNSQTKTSVICIMWSDTTYLLSHHIVFTIRSNSHANNARFVDNVLNIASDLANNFSCMYTVKQHSDVDVANRVLSTPYKQ